MSRKIMSMAGLWLILALLVFVYTDRDAFVWRYDAANLGQILITNNQVE